MIAGVLAEPSSRSGGCEPTDTSALFRGKSTIFTDREALIRQRKGYKTGGLRPGRLLLDISSISLWKLRGIRLPVSGLSYEFSAIKKGFRLKPLKTGNSGYSTIGYTEYRRSFLIFAMTATVTATTGSAEPATVTITAAVASTAATVAATAATAKSATAATTT